jgi:hypothetical protein
MWMVGVLTDTKGAEDRALTAGGPGRVGKHIGDAADGEPLRCTAAASAA